MMKVKLKDIADINMGQSPKGDTYNNNNNGMPFLQGRKTFGRIFPFIDTWTTNPIKIAEKDSILMSVRAPVGDMNISNQKICIGRGLCSINMHNSNNKYLYYLLLANISKLKENSTGTVFDSINRTDLENLELNIENEENQNKIVNILGTIDDKIEENNQINDNLLNLTKSNYIQWFKKYKVPNKTLNLKNSEIGQIPDKWEIKWLKDVFFFQEGPGIRNWQYVEEDGTKFINIRCIKDDDLDLSTANMISNEEANGKYAHFMLKPWDVVVSTSGTLGRSQIIREEHLPLCLNTSVIRFEPLNGMDEYAFMYNYLISNEFLNLLDTLATGSAQRNFGPVHLRQIKLLVPDKDTLKEFNNINFPIIKKIEQNKSENIYLQNLRDTLLPKLMNGEIDLDKVEI